MRENACVHEREGVCVRERDRMRVCESGRVYERKLLLLLLLLYCLFVVDPTSFSNTSVLICHANKAF